ncbi:hypothetical protein MRB53_016155 [Persea americana]|uniref:Uncharacterized protein n=1 Tax=Persea americana TaxID=3435 RepID=A0ACC2M110_PERAE|nr:hypothetical protein MRB53_016155 [Persea americana]
MRRWKLHVLINSNELLASQVSHQSISLNVSSALRAELLIFLFQDVSSSLRCSSPTRAQKARFGGFYFGHQAMVGPTW